MAKVFGGGGSSPAPGCGDGGVSRVLPTSSEVLRAGPTQTFSSSPNVYSKSQSAIGDSNLQDFYTKSEVQKLLRVKADISSVYAKEEVDGAIGVLEAEVNASLLEFITEAEVNTKISASYSSVLSYLAQNHYSSSQLYTKAEITSLLAAVQPTTDFIRKQPSSTASNTISPGANEAIPLTLVASTDPDITTIQHWIDTQSNSVGRVRTSGQVEFYGNMMLGQNIEGWRAALDTNQRRISGVADPIQLLDAVNKKYMEDYIVYVVDNIQRGEDGIYDIDARIY